METLSHQDEAGQEYLFAFRAAVVDVQPAHGTTKAFLQSKFRAKTDILAANLAAMEAGWSYGETTESFATAYEVAPAPMPKQDLSQYHLTPRSPYGLVGSTSPACAWSLGSYPITPA
ncbi:MAG: 2-oxoglutarate ferredoxin oxidoreductase subunit alpha, partial [Tetrasphaera sp.]|nr:2-oxoglutarate ferredoxin oxidoreductase subunit alpha [Tetrasphaera sp.]